MPGEYGHPYDDTSPADEQWFFEEVVKTTYANDGLVADFDIVEQLDTEQGVPTDAEGDVELTIPEESPLLAGYVEYPLADDEDDPGSDQVNYADYEPATDPEEVAKHITRVKDEVIAAKDAEIAAKDAEIKRITAITEWLIVDDLTGQLTRKGLNYRLRTNKKLMSEFTEALQSARYPERESSSEEGIGVLNLDVNGVKAANKYGTPIGDKFIKKSMGIIVEELNLQSRQSQRRVEVQNPDDSIETTVYGADGNIESQTRTEAPQDTTKADITEDKRVITSDRREAEPRYPDILVRWGGDEITVVIRNVTAVELKRIADRLQAEFTVESASTRYGQREVPMMAAIGYASLAEAMATGILDHLSDNPTPDEAYQAIEGMVGVADARQREVKKRQYNQMWTELVAHRKVNNPGKRFRRPRENRVIIDQYWEVFFPDFAANPEAFLENAA